MSSSNKDLHTGRNYIWRLIKYRLRSEKEIRDKLKFKRYDAAIIEALITYFKDLGYINDREFANSWISSRLSKPLGFRVIRWELKEKGIGKALIDELLNKTKDSLNEPQIVQELASRQYNRLKERREPLDKVKRKLYTYLIRRGFSSDTVIEIIKKTFSTPAVEKVVSSTPAVEKVVSNGH